MFELRCGQKELGWRVEMEEGAKWVHGDESKLRQVLINLLGNAVKFTDSGEVVLQLSAEPEDRYRFEVYDTGPGIPSERQTAILEPFEQDEGGVQKGGTGLGLAIARRHVDLMGGRLELESEVGRGSRFFFTLMLPPAQGGVEIREEDRWRRVRRVAENSTVDVLVVDDVVENREVLGGMLSAIGVDERGAGSGSEAVEKVRESLPDLIFMDIHMSGMDGVEAMGRIWEEHGRESVKIVGCSASVMAHERQSYLEAGFDAFIGKPFRREQVYACLADLLGVEYEYEHPSSTPETPVPDLQGIVLPEDLFVHLEEAARLYSVTELEEYLDEVHGLGAEGQRLADHLRALSREYNMDAILNILKEIRHE